MIPNTHRLKADQEHIIAVIKNSGRFFTAGIRFVDALKKKPPHEDACWNCEALNKPIVFFNVGKDCRSLGWFESGMPEQIFVCHGCAPLYMTTFNVMMGQDGGDEANIQIWT